jgi:hypothetical protein
MDEFEAPRRVSRRDLLKRGAVAGGLLWTAPVIQSLRTPAFAASGDFEACCQCSQSPPFPGIKVGLSCTDCAAACAAHGGVRSYTRGVGCAVVGHGCAPTDTCPELPCAWESTGPQKLKRTK